MKHKKILKKKLRKEFIMKINDFNEKNEVRKAEMSTKLNGMKLENIRSLWYFVHAKAKVILGSKG
ncbi:hypothetical protein ADH70_008000 [Blautia pseudococcoides]|uniref:Uncharacterized protein n=1 Tax=Blautia pseudococcoides TaxID=1796616 RepID=A0A1C7I8K6_9FIRM|nr:hypothetical protein [uncultured Blautia sp.]ANU75986.1 hypothetical protein A4V09_09565 [Blautia pseudococcoides]ASU28796.1 hypothetical protein ADH70_008000 [Blautia pseudococcoides]